MKKLTLLLSLLVSLLFASRSVAQTERRWLSDMPDSMRLSQLSIPKAHDAATWNLSGGLIHPINSMYKCQSFNESSLFKLGVRSFDLRLGAECKRTGERKYEITHIAFYHASNEVISYENEVNGWPTKEDLDGGNIRNSEFLIFNIGVDYDNFEATDKGYSGEAYQRRMVMDSILYTIKDRYGTEDLAGNPRFVPFRADMTVAEMRGKIFVFFGVQSSSVADLVGYKYRNWVTINCPESDKDKVKILAEKPDNKDGHIIQSIVRAYSDESTSERDAKNSKTVVNCLLSQQYSQDNRRSSVMADYFRWAEEFFHAKIDMLNTQNIIFDGHLNGWAIMGFMKNAGPYKTASDDALGYLGANHLAYNYIRTTKKPLGIVGFDFCGDDSGGSWGDKLLKEIIRHNYIQKELMAKANKGYIADVILVHVPKTGDETGDGLKAQEKMRELGGYEMVGDPQNGADIIRDNKYDPGFFSSVISGAPTRIFMGVKYTHDPDSALTNLMLVEHADNGSIHNDYLNFHYSRYNKDYDPKPDDDIEFWGSRYYQPVKTYDYNTGTGWNGNLTIHMGRTTPFIYLWQEKHPRYNDSDKGGVLTDIEVLHRVDKDKIESTANLVPYMSMHGTSKEDWVHGAGPDEFDKGNRSLELPLETYLRFDKHLHNQDGRSYNDTVHFSSCTYCGYKFNGHAHTYSGAHYDPDYLGISHFAICDDTCGYVSPNAEPCVGPVDSYGFGKCTKCGQDFVEPAKRTADGTYEVSNAAQLYWINLNVTINNEILNVKLTSDICFPDSMQWTPIGTREKPFMGSFDGQGHTISNMNVSGTQYLGLFGDINKATVKNLGLVKSKITGSKYIGSIAGRATNSTIENVFSTADIHVSDNNNVPIYFNDHIVGGITGQIQYSIFRNIFYDGEITAEDSNILSNIYMLGSAFSVEDSENYFVKDSKNESINKNWVTVVTDADFTSGKLCYLLNEGKYGADAMWRQNIDASEVDALDDAPCFNKDHQMVIPGKLNGKEYIGATFSNNAYSRKNLNIEDGHDFQIPVELHILDATTYSRNVEGYKWGTICLPFEIKSNTDVQYYTLDATPGSGDISYVQVENVEKNTPALFKKLTDITTLNLSAQGNTITPPAYNDSIRQAGNAFYSLIGTFEQRKVYEDPTLTKRYLLNNNLYMVNKHIVVNPFRVWLENIPRRGEGPTAIEDLIIDANHPDNLMYDTFGHRIAAPQKGQIIIKNGKKQINK